MGPGTEMLVVVAEVTAVAVVVALALVVDVSVPPVVVLVVVRVRDFVVVVVLDVVTSGLTNGTPSFTVGRACGMSSTVRLFSTHRPTATAVTAARQTASTPMTILVACRATNLPVGVRSAATAASSS
ncbi:Uncharacterised protein [Mycobacteroides abscessus]|nr:Uncharacterised protein [Mycobacteroides abscessus]